mmetsp:Transcript_6774/g.7389  ORF Transcript_6774/g.7389 Transcript_6774/m.7389 type:complete len:555 (+) Transcript_6774:38-1702(+)
MPPKVNKIEAEIKRLSKLDGNKTCADCPEKVPGYVDLNHNVFICTKCSGIHREFQFKVKGVSMTVFTAEDVEGLAAMGNENFNSIYLANLNPRDYIVPNGSDLTKLKEFIRMKYIDKRWHRDGRGGGGGSGSGGGFATDFHSSGSTGGGGAQPDNSNKIALKLNTGTRATPVSRRASTGAFEIKKTASAGHDTLAGELDLLSMSDNTTTTTSTTQSQPHSSFDPFGPSQSKASSSHDPFGASDGFGSTNNHDPFGSNNHSNGGFDAFGGPTPTKAVDPFDPFGSQKPAASSSVHSGFDAFGASHQTSNHAFDPFGNPPQQHAQPMPFIQVNPPSNPAPVAEKPASNAPPAAPQPPKKDFGAFDDLLGPAAAPEVNHHSNNPFDSHFGGPPAAAPRPAYQGQPPAYNAAPYGYPPQQPPNAGYGAPYGAPVNYPPQYGYPNPAYPPQYPPAGYPAGPYPGQPGAPPNPHYGLPPQPAPTQPIISSAPPPAAPVAHDPFAAMSSAAWNAVGGSAPSASSQSKPPNSYPMPTPVAQPAAPVHQPQTTQQSVNPFDLF